MTVNIKCDVILIGFLPSQRRKIKIELEDENGEKYNLSLQGTLSREKIMNVIEFVQLLEKNSANAKLEDKHGDVNLASKLWHLITENFRYHTFTSSDLLRIYQNLYYEPIQLSVISIYLSRFYLKKHLSRSKNGKHWVYALIKESAISLDKNYEKPNHSNLLSAPTVYDLHL